MKTILARAVGVASVLAATSACGGGGDITVTPPHTVSIVAGSGSGSIKSSDSKIDCHVTAGVTDGPKCSTTYNEGAKVTLTATADADQEFKAWSGDCSGSTTCQLTVSRDMFASPGFVAAKQTFDLDFQTPASDDGAVIITVQGPSVLGVVQTAGLDLGQQTTTSGNVTTSTIMVRGNLTSGTVAKVTVRGIHVVTSYTVKVIEVAARKSGNYAERADIGAYSASLK